MFWVKTGARDEDERVAGVSHFLEHMAFKRTATRTYEEINRQFEEEMGAENMDLAGDDGISTPGARRSDPRRRRPPGRPDRPVLDTEDFDQERNVILEEIARHNDRPAVSLMFDEFFKTFFSGQPLGHSTLGTPETIGALTVDQMREYWRCRYVPDNIIFSIAGNFDSDAIVAQLQDLTASWPRSEAPRLPVAAAAAPLRAGADERPLESGTPGSRRSLDQAGRPRLLHGVGPGDVPRRRHRLPPVRRSTRPGLPIKSALV